MITLLDKLKKHKKGKKLIIICSDESPTLSELDSFAEKSNFQLRRFPESGLTSQQQIKFIREIAKLINKGLSKYIIYTHSDYIIKELNILIMLHEYKNRITEFSDYNVDMCINYKNILALSYNFNEQSIEKLKIDKTGFSINHMDRVINRLNEVSQKLYFGMYDY